MDRTSRARLLLRLFAISNPEVPLSNCRTQASEKVILIKDKYLLKNLAKIRKLKVSYIIRKSE